MTRSYRYHSKRSIETRENQKHTTKLMKAWLTKWRGNEPAKNGKLAEMVSEVTRIFKRSVEEFKSVDKRNTYYFNETVKCKEVITSQALTITDLTDRNDTLEAKIEDLEDQLTDPTDKVEELEAQLKEARKQVESLKKESDIKSKAGRALMQHAHSLRESDPQEYQKMLAIYNRFLKVNN